jgi:DNA-binding MarR family transcriptional regulator
LSSVRRRGALAQAARTNLALRNLRRQLLGTELSSEHCWELLLTLYVNWSQGARISVTDLANETCIAPATVIRWLTVLANNLMICREADPHDGRRTWISLTRAAVEKIEQVLAAQAFGAAQATTPVNRAA